VAVKACWPKRPRVGWQALPVKSKPARGPAPRPIVCTSFLLGGSGREERMRPKVGSQLHLQSHYIPWVILILFSAVVRLHGYPEIKIGWRFEFGGMVQGQSERPIEPLGVAWGDENSHIRAANWLGSFRPRLVACQNGCVKSMARSSRDIHSARLSWQTRAL
jgi:hypothetical protein